MSELLRAYGDTASYCACCVLLPLGLVGAQWVIHSQTHTTAEERRQARLEAVRRWGALWFAAAALITGGGLIADAARLWIIPDGARISWVPVPSTWAWLLLFVTPALIAYGLWKLRRWGTLLFAAFFAILVPGMLWRAAEGSNLPIALNLTAIAVSIVYVWKWRKLT